MVQHELRIHYGAPSLVSDDARWRSLANNIVNFEASNTFRITSRRGFETTTTNNSSEVRSISVEPKSERRFGERTIEEQLDIQGQGLNGSLPSTGAVRKRKCGDDAVNPCKVKRNKRTCFARTKKGLNPVFKNPVTAYLAVDKQGERTPKPKVKNVQPQPTVLVPFTGSPKQRRARPATTPNQQCSTDTDVSGFLSSSRVRATSFDLQDSFATEILDHESSPVRTGDQPLAFQTQIVQEVSLTLTQTSLYSKTTPTEIISSDFEKDEDLGKLRQVNPIATRSFSVSTESPTQAQDIQPESSPLAHRSVPVQANVVDLTEESAPRELTRRDVLGSMSSPAINTNELTPPSEVVCPRMTKRKLLALPKRIYCSAPINEFENFQSFVPESLRALANKFELAKKFRPVEAVERIKNGDRGYWRVLIRITSLVVVAKSRRSPLSSSQWSDEKFLLAQKACRSTASPSKSTDIEDVMRRQHYPNKSPTTFTPWTLNEFVDFWALLRKTIENGRAGYDVHATIADDMAECEEGVYMEVRFYGYAEALSHMWCILYVLSNKKAAYMPMQWMGTGQGTLIRMSGQPKGGGSTGRWIELSPGIQGSWGFATFSEELNRVGGP